MWYLASNSRGVSAHFVVRVVVMALESALADATEISSSTKLRSLILMFRPDTFGGSGERQHTQVFIDDK